LIQDSTSPRTCGDIVELVAAHLRFIEVQHAELLVDVIDHPLASFLDIFGRVSVSGRGHELVIEGLGADDDLEEQTLLQLLASLADEMARLHVPQVPFDHR
jgi:hypothetical protein